MAQRDIEGLFKSGDELFQHVSRRGQEVNWDDVKKLVRDILWEYNINIASNDEFDNDESPTVDESFFDEDKDSEESGDENTGIAAAIDIVRTTSNIVAGPTTKSATNRSGTTAGTGVQPANIHTTATTINTVPISRTIAPTGAATATTTPTTDVPAAPVGAATTTANTATTTPTTNVAVAPGAATTTTNTTTTTPAANATAAPSGGNSTDVRAATVTAAAVAPAAGKSTADFTTANADVDDKVKED